MLLTLGEYAGRLVEQGVDGEGLLQVPLLALLVQKYTYRHLRMSELST